MSCQRDADSQTPGEAIAQLGVGQAFGEMSLLSGGPPTPTIRAAEDTDLMKIGKKDFDQLVAADRQLADAVQQISHQRAISNLSAGGTDAALWAKVASRSLDHLNRHESRKMLKEAANRRDGNRVREYPGHHPRLPRDRGKVHRLREPFADADAWHVPGRDRRGGCERVNADQSGLPSRGDLRTVVDGAWPAW